MTTALVLSINSALANISSERLEAYKANKLIPENIKIETSGSSLSDNVFVFSNNTYSWSIESAGNVLNAVYKDWTESDFRNRFPMVGYTSDYKYHISATCFTQADIDYLCGVINGSINSEHISSESAKWVLEDGTDNLAHIADIKVREQEEIALDHLTIPTLIIDVSGYSPSNSEDMQLLKCLYGRSEFLQKYKDLAPDKVPGGIILKNLSKAQLSAMKEPIG